MRREVSMPSSPLQRQGLGEHDFFGQDNQHYNSRSDNRDGPVQFRNILLASPNPEHLEAGNMRMEYTPGGKGSGMPIGNAGSSFPSIHMAHPQAGAFVDGRRNQAVTTQQSLSDSQNTSSKLNSFLPVNIGMLDHHSNVGDVGSTSGLHHQNQYYRYASQNQAGATNAETLSGTFPLHQLPNGPAPVAPEAQPGGSTRGFGMTELQLLRQQALQSKQQQALQYKQQQAMRLQQQEAMRAQQEEATRQQQQVSQKQDAFRMQQQQEAMRVQQQDMMQAQQQEKFRMQQRALYLQQQGAARTQEQNTVASFQVQDGMWSKQQDTTRLQQQQALLSQQQKAVWCQQEPEQSKGLHPQQQGAWQSHQHQTLSCYQQQPSPYIQRQVLQSYQGQAFQPHHQHSVQSQQQQGLGSQQKQLVQPQQQALQQSSQSQQKQISSPQHCTLRSQQELFEVQPVMSQGTCEELPGTSYSALLHGPDTPPSYPQTGGETLSSDLENTTVAFPPANTQSVGWPTYGTSYYQELPSAPSTGQNTVASQNLLPPSHPRDDNNLALTGDQGRRNLLHEYPGVGSSATSSMKPVFQSNVAVSGNADMGGFGAMDDLSLDVRSKHQVPGNSFVQSPHDSGRQSVRMNGLSNGLIQTGLLSQSQQHFPGLQVSQQRSWERLEQKHGVSKPSFSEIRAALPMMDSLQQKLSSTGTSPSHGPENLGSANATGYKQHRMFPNAVGEMAAFNRDQQEGQNSMPGSVNRPLKINQDAEYNSCPDFNTRNDTWGNIVAQQATAIVQTSVHSVSPLESTSKAMLNVDQQSFLELQVPPKSTTLRKAEENLVWKENDIRRQTIPCFSEPDSYPQGFWKGGASFHESVVDTTCGPSNRDGNSDTWKGKFQPEKPNFDAQLNMQAPLTFPNSPRWEDNTDQRLHKKRFLRHEGPSQQVHNLNGVGSQPFSNPVEALSDGTAASYSEVGQIHRLNTHIELQGSAVERHRVSELQMDPSSRSVSLAHLRQSQPSSPLSPQHVKLGLGPANLPQNIQQAGDGSMWTSPQIGSSYQKIQGPWFNTEGKEATGMPQGGSGYERPAGGRSDLNQGMSASMNGTVNNARPSSALSNSSSFSKESGDSEAVLPGSFTQVLEGSGNFQGFTNFKRNTVSGVGTNAGYFEEESSSILHGKLKPAADSSRQPLHITGNNQGQLSTGPPHSTVVAGSLRVLQNQQIINMALKQLGNKAQAANLAGLLTTLKTSFSEHSRISGNCETMPPGIVEPGQSGSAQDGSAPQLMRNPQMILRKPVNPGHGQADCSPFLRAGSLPGLNEYNHNNHNTISQGEEGSGPASTSLTLDSQRQNRQSPLMNGSRPWNSEEQAANFSVLRALNPGSLHTEVQLRDSVSDTQPANFGQGKYPQQQTPAFGGLSLQHASKVTAVDLARTATLSTALDTVNYSNEAQLKAFKNSSTHGYLRGVTIGERYGTFLGKQNHNSAMELEELQQQKASSLKYVSQGSLQSVDSSPSRHGQASRQTAINASTASPLPSTDGVNEPVHKRGLHSEISNNAVLQNEQKQEFYTAHCKPENFPHKFLAKDVSQPVANIDGDLPSSTGRGNGGVKVEDARPGVKGHIPRLNQSPQRQPFSSKMSFVGPSAIHPKKRKKPVPLLIPWYIAATQPRDSLPSTSEMELMWANSANRLCDKDDGDPRKENVASSIKAKRRLRLTTQLMQQLIPPLPGELMQGNMPVDNECATFSLAKFALEDACRLVTKTRREATAAHDCPENKNMPLRGQGGRTGGIAKSAAVTRCVESFMGKARGLESELARVETSFSATDLRWEIRDIEEMGIVNRLARHHGASFTVDSPELSLLESSSDVNAGVWKPSPKKYVTRAPMPRTLPGVKCLSL